MGPRRHIVYLLAAVPPSEASSQPKTRIISGRRSAEDEEDELQLLIFSRILLHQQKDTTFDKLHSRLPYKWIETEPYDTVNPFGDSRAIDFKALWTFDIQKDLLIHINRRRRAHISLSVLRSRPVTLGDMETLGPPVPPLLPVPSTLDSAVPCWKPQVQVDERNRAFLHRVLRDFNHQWRHLLRNNYNTITLRVLARAVIRLCTLDFEVREETGRRIGVRGEWVYITELPKWEPFDADIVRVGGVYVVVCHSIRDGLSSVKKHISSQELLTVAERTRYCPQNRPDYMILSVKHIALCRATGPNSLECTAPEPLFNGNHSVEPPSDLALDYLLWPTAAAIRSIDTPLRLLPAEIQDMILRYSSRGPVAAAMTGCLLGLGTPFLWKDGRQMIGLEDFRRDHHPWMPVESQLWFSESKVGVVYRARA